MSAVAELMVRRGLPVGAAERVRDQLVEARSRWPNGPDPDATFVDLIAHGLARSAPEQLRIVDLYLAWWCGRGDAAGVAAFEGVYAEDLQAAAARFREVPPDELRQQLSVKLFVGADGAAPKIRDYSGAGSLKSWLRVTAVRTFIDLTRSQRALRYERELDDGELLGLSDPQQASIRAELGAKVKTAFSAAVAKLPPRYRVFLRHAYVDRHTLDQIALMYSLHRTTVARTLAAAREQLIADTRAALVAGAGIADDELTSVVRALDTGIDLSLSRVLADG